MRLPRLEFGWLPSRWGRLGFAGFLFFLIKGLLWLVVTAALWISV